YSLGAKVEAACAVEAEAMRALDLVEALRVEVEVVGALNLVEVEVVGATDLVKGALDLVEVKVSCLVRALDVVGLPLNILSSSSVSGI
nr:hypothetical protein [Tanacetum cinerariifolium]